MFRNNIGVWWGIIHPGYISKIPIDRESGENLGDQFFEGPVRSTLLDGGASTEDNGSKGGNGEA